jgi:hypothetical protein
MPSSLKRIEANRRNAQKSTGPKTPEGKERSRANATTHGLTAVATIYRPLRSENPDEFFELRAKLVEDFRPETTAEHLAIEMAASAYKRIQRAELMEAAYFDGTMAAIQRRHGKEPAVTANEALGSAIALGEKQNKLTWENLDRYRRSAWTDYNRSIEQLRKLQRERVDAELRALRLHEKQQRYLERTHVPTARKVLADTQLASFRDRHHHIANRLTRRTLKLVPRPENKDTEVPKTSSTEQDTDSPCDSSNS